MLAGAVESYFDLSFNEDSSDVNIYEVYKSASGDVVSKLKLVKDCMDELVNLAGMYADETGKPFSEMLQTGIMSIVKSAKNYRNAQEIPFVDYVRQEMIRAMMSSD